jgi:hypothetical protein
MNWKIGTSYNLIEKGGTVTELGKLLTIYPDGSLEFKKSDNCTHVYTVELNVRYEIRGS